MIKKFLAFLCVCVFCSGCGVKDSNTVIKFSTWGSASELAILKPIISEFEKENHNVRVELYHIPQDYFKKLHLLFASNLAPDVIFINNINLPVYVNYLEALDSVIEKKDFFEKSISALSYQSSLYAVPRDVSNLVIYYNKDLFKRCGVEFPQEDWTIEDLVHKAGLLTGNGVFGISYEPLLYYALPYISYYGGGILSEDSQLVFELEPSQKGVTLYKDLAYKYCYAPMPAQIGSKTLAQMFLEGRIAMHLSGRWLVPKYRECAIFDWDVVNFPQYAVPCDASGWAVSKYSKNKGLAYKFVLFLSDKKNIEKMTADGLIVPARLDVAKSSVFLSGKPEHSSVFISTVDYSKNYVVSKDYNRLIDKINDLVFNAEK